MGGAETLGSRTFLLLAGAALLACDGEADPLTAPADDSPNLALFDPPPRVADGEFVTLEIMATDDVGLDRVTVFWGEVGSPLEVLPVVGDSAAWVRSHLFRGPGFYTIRVQVTDTSDQVVTRVWGVTVDPNGGAIAAATRTYGQEDSDEGYKLFIDGVSVRPLKRRDSTIVEHVEVGPRDVFLGDVTANCEVPSNPRKVTVALGDTAIVRFDISCR